AVVYFEMRPVLDYLNDYIAHPDYEKLKAFTNSVAMTKFSSPEMSGHFREFLDRFNSLVNVNYDKAILLSVQFLTEFLTVFLNSPVVVCASGAVFGLLFAYGMLFPNSLIYIYFAIPIKAKYFVILYGAVELFSGIASVPGDNVAHFAH